MQQGLQYLVCVCVVVRLSVTILVAVGFIHSPKLRYHSDLFIMISWILTHGFRKKGFVQETWHYLLTMARLDIFR